MEEFLSIAVVGGLLSLLVQGLKNYLGTEKFITKLLTFVLALVVGTVYVLLRDTIWWQTTLVVLGSASTVYAFLLK